MRKFFSLTVAATLLALTACGTSEYGQSASSATLDSQLEKIKKGGTAPGAIAFELSDTTTPVQLVAADNFGMTEIGRLTIGVTQ